MNENLSPSATLIASLKKLEGFTPNARILPGDVSVFTYGYGDTDCKPGDSITEPEAAIRLTKRAKGFGDQVIKLVTVQLTQGQYDATTSLAYNVGSHAFPTLIKKLNSGDIQGAANEFLRFTKANGKVLPGLVRRRSIERSWFLGFA